MESIDASRLRSQKSILETAVTEGVAAAAPRNEGRRDSQSQATRQIRDNPLLAALDRKLASFEAALDSFQWPETDFPWRNARLTAKDPNLRGKVAVATAHQSELQDVAQATPDDQVAQFYKFFSRGVDPATTHGLAPKTYALTLALGNHSETLKINVDDSLATWGELFTALRDAVNDSRLPIQATILNQAGVGQRTPELMRTRSVLALNVDRGVPSQNLELNKAQQLTFKLDFEATESPIDQAAIVSRHNLEGRSSATPTTLFSRNFDPQALTTLAPTTYYIAYRLGQNSGTVGVEVTATDTWAEVLQRASSAFSGNSSLLQATVVEPNAPAYPMAGAQVQTRDKRLSLWPGGPKLGERMQLGQGQAPNQASFHDPNSSKLLPIGSTGDIYIASDTGNGWTKDRVYTYGGEPYAWHEITPSTGDTYYMSDQGANYSYDAPSGGGSGWSATQDFLAALGLDSEAYPGSDATLVADGQSMRSATGVFSMDRGRLLVAEQIAFGETLPVYVSKGLDRISSQLSEIVGAYNGLQSFLAESSDRWKRGFADKWKNPVEILQPELDWLGVEPLGAKKFLWINGDTFIKALSQAPDRARATLNGSTEVSGAFLSASIPGLVPMWKAQAATTRRDGLASMLATPDDATPAPVGATTTLPPWRRGQDNAESMQLLDLYG